MFQDFRYIITDQIYKYKQQYNPKQLLYINCTENNYTKNQLTVDNAKDPR